MAYLPDFGHGEEDGSELHHRLIKNGLVAALLVKARRSSVVGLDAVGVLAELQSKVQLTDVV